MRLRERDKRDVVFRPRESAQEPDGTTSYGWGAPQTVRGTIQPAVGRVMAELYGERLAYMWVMYTDQPALGLEAAGVCLFAADPDYKAVAIRPWNGHTVIDMEAINR